jgi:nucleotide-binding universal stress UspA family protein
MTAPIAVLVRGPQPHRALRWAAAEAGRRGAELQALVDDTPQQPATGSVFARAIAALRRAVPELPLTARGTGGPVVAALRTRSVDAGLVVVPAGLPEVADVVAQSYCPVVTVPDEPPRVGGPVLVGVVPWTPEAAVDLAFAAAEDRRVGLVAVRAWDDPALDLGLLRPDRIDRWDGVEHRAARELELALSAQRVVHPLVPVQPMVVQDGPTELLLALSTRAQLLVLGRSERGALLTGLAGSPVAELLGAVCCPVVVVPADGPPRAAWLPGRARARALIRS